MTERKSYWPHLAAIAALWAAAMTADFYEEQRERFDDATAWKESYRDALLACMNRGSFWFADTGEAFECEAKSLGRSAK